MATKCADSRRASHAGRESAPSLFAVFEVACSASLLRVRYAVGRELENISTSFLSERSPVSYIRLSPCCGRAEGLEWRPLSLPLMRAMAMPSRVRLLMRAASDSAKMARMFENVLPV